MSRTMFTFTACLIRGSDSSLGEITFTYSTKTAVLRKKEKNQLTYLNAINTKD